MIQKITASETQALLPNLGVYADNNEELWRRVDDGTMEVFTDGTGVVFLANGKQIMYYFQNITNIVRYLVAVYGTGLTCVLWLSNSPENCQVLMNEGFTNIIHSGVDFIEMGYEQTVIDEMRRIAESDGLHPSNDDCKAVIRGYFSELISSLKGDAAP